MDIVKTVPPTTKTKSPVQQKPDRFGMIDKLDYWLQPIDTIFADFAEHVVGQDKERRIFIDRGGSILFVAHLDTVHPPKYKRTRGHKAKRIYAQGLDDRLGCLIAYELSERLGADLLLTDNEEIFQTSARYHDCRDYNWIAEFDRAGGDVVTYDLDSPDFLSALGEYFPIGMGAYSDICDLETEAACVNIGIGYELAHSLDSYVVVQTMQDQIERFLLFYAENKDIVYRHAYPVWEDRLAYSNRCDVCSIAHADEIHGYFLCEDCFYTIFEAHIYNQEKIR